MDHWLRLCTSNAGFVSLIPGQETKIPHALWRGQKKKKKEIILNGFCPSSFFILEFVDTFFVLSTLFRSRLVRFLCQDLLAVGAASLLVLASEEDTLLSPTAP